MKTCSYCGQENEDTRATCHECGTAIRLTEPPPASPVVTTDTDISASPLPPATSAASSFLTTIRQALFTCAGIIFVSTAVLMISQRFFFDLQESAHGGPIGKPGIYAVGMLFAPFVILWLLVNLVFSQRICDNRIASRKLATLLSLLSFILTLLFVWQRDLRSFLPAIILRRSFGLPPGYPGALLQFLFGAFLLGWLQIWLRKLRKITPTSPVNASESR